MQVTEGFDRERAWLVAAVVSLLALVGGSLAFPRTVYDRFIWQYFWGPVYADAHNARCAINSGTSVELLGSSDACQAAIDRGAVVAEPGYTPVSEVGYMAILLFMLIGVLYLLRRLDVGREHDLFFAMVPFMLFGGALRVVEDAFDATPAGVDPLVTYPWNSLIISPVIYGTVFLITLAAVVFAVKLDAEGIVEDSNRTLTLLGAGVFTVTFGYLAVLAVTTDYVSFYPQILLLVVGISTALAWGIYEGIERFAPEINRGTGKIGFVVIWGHAIDGVANVIAADWAMALGLPFTYGAKHPVNRFIIGLTDGLLPPSLASAIGTSWPFLVVKLIVAVGIIWLFDERFMKESTRYALLLLIAAVAVGLGPGTRDMLRVTFGI
ncbi:DUF63 family protein [Haloarculaceae archaeon H-GB2-1]|nr:DUF63 family protein [Haloarculaceae archaeon H-GB1-1]MEA5386166.1 DUF63 family protein [Haloarculaceae archaeon H-GB11]MEA5407672.1 DUF63 family protein [Haloarculaceae archaeon H-GB2-1]